jgi:hypothetical protein
MGPNQKGIKKKQKRKRNMGYQKDLWRKQQMMKQRKLNG